jgi:hypothetical protein
VSASNEYDAFFIRPDIEPDRAIMLGVEWLIAQPGEPLILLHARKMVSNNRLLEHAVAQRRIRAEAPGTIWRNRPGWQGGPILAPWASPEVLRCIDDDLRRLATAVCVIGWRDDDPNHQAWVAVRNAVDLETGAQLGREQSDLVGDPVIRIALDHAEQFVNHNNMLVQAEDKDYVVRTLQELVASGHSYDLDELAAYAMATGWTGDEVKRLREYGQKVLDGRSFRLRTTIGPKRGTARQWEEEAAALAG